MILGIIASGQISVSSGGGSPTFSATGGTKSTSGAYTYHLFTGNGTFTPNGSGTVEIIVVGGGGKGGTLNTDGKGAYGSGGGGGGGRYLLSTGVAVTAQAYAVVIGSGATDYGTTGGTSNIGALASAAGGSSGRNDDVSSTQYGAGGTAPSGAGSPCRWVPTPLGSGGGASNSTNGGTAGASSGVGGVGAAGIVNSFPVGPSGFSGGGGGGGSTSGGAGGTYGGGLGRIIGQNSPPAGVAGTANTGGGGGAGGGDIFGGAGQSGNGGTGVVIVRYLT